MTTNPPARADVPTELTWDTSLIFATLKDWEVAFTRVGELVNAIPQYRGTLGQGHAQLHTALSAIDEVRELISRVYTYAHLVADVDTTDDANQGLVARAQSLYGKVNSSLSWVEPELLSMDWETLDSFLSQDDALEQYRPWLVALFESKEHVLPSEQEKLIAATMEILEAPYTTFSVLSNADLPLPEVAGENGPVQLTHGTFRQLLDSTDREVRKGAWNAMYDTHLTFARTFASTLSTEVKKNNALAEIYGYNDAREMYLSRNRVPGVVFETLMDVANRRLPLLHRYMEIRRRLLGVDKLHQWDLHAPLLPAAEFKVDYERAKDITLEALAPMGEDYLDIVREAYSSRWIDVVENKGKRSGAYSSGSYRTAPYILLNWHDSLDHLHTLIHEMGHSVHSYLTRANQPFITGDYPIFVAEIASTTNEALLTEHLLATQEDPRIRATVLNQYLNDVKGTFFRQAQFAEFEDLIHTAAAEGTPLTSEFLNAEYLRINGKYYGPEVVNDDKIRVEWARIPHFYYTYYVYQYATGFAAASTLSRGIVDRVPGAVDRYKDFLKAGKSDTPIAIMQHAGVDMTKPDYLEAAMDLFERRLDEFETLVAELEK